jgi:FAD/FMN-containing dehydrogenase
VTAWAVEDLEHSIDGEVALPESELYERIRAPAIARFASTPPRAVVLCEGPGDIAETLRLARQAEVPVAIRSGGHCFAGRSSSAGVVIDVSGLDTVSVSGDIAFVGAGARLGRVYDALDAYGLTIPAGCGPTVGIGGLTLGGGLGVLGRRHGLTCDNLRAAEVVLADGRIVVCDRNHEPDLFWALRGAGGAGFAVVTTLVFDTIPAPQMTAFELTWRVGDAAAVIGGWQVWAPDAPEEMVASLLIEVPPVPDERATVKVFGAAIATDGAAAAALEDLVAGVGVNPESDDRRTGPHRDVKRHLAGEGEADDARHTFIKSEFFAQSLPVAAVDALVRHACGERVAGEARELDFTPRGGAYTRPEPHDTAFVQRGERFLLKHAVTVEPDADADPARRWLAGSFARTRPWGAGTVYPNFPEPEIDPLSEAHFGANRERLVRVRAAYQVT